MKKIIGIILLSCGISVSALSMPASGLCHEDQHSCEFSAELISRFSNSETGLSIISYCEYKEVDSDLCKGLNWIQETDVTTTGYSADARRQCYSERKACVEAADYFANYTYGFGALFLSSCNYDDSSTKCDNGKQWYVETRVITGQNLSDLNTSKCPKGKYFSIDHVCIQKGGMNHMPF